MAPADRRVDLSGARVSSTAGHSRLGPQDAVLLGVLLPFSRMEEYWSPHWTSAREDRGHGGCFPTGLGLLVQQRTGRWGSGLHHATPRTHPTHETAPPGPGTAPCTCWALGGHSRKGRFNPPRGQTRASQVRSLTQERAWSGRRQQLTDTC